LFGGVRARATGKGVSQHVFIAPFDPFLMLGRQKVLLRLVSALEASGKAVTKTFLDKLLFVIAKEGGLGGAVKFYNFFPYKFGPFSNNFYADLARLQSDGLLDCNLKLAGAGERVAANVPARVAEAVEGVTGRFRSANQTVKYVYAAYPEYTVKSELKQHIEERKEPGIFSIGYEGKDIDSFLDALVRNGIEAVVDVRANAFSMNFAFSKKKLAHSLELAGIGYLHVPELGIPGKYRKGLEAGDYSELFDFYEKGILGEQAEAAAAVAKMGKERRIALLCFEADAGNCHRGVLARHLEKLGSNRAVHL